MLPSASHRASRSTLAVIPSDATTIFSRSVTRIPTVAETALAFLIVSAFWGLVLYLALLASS